MVSVGTNDNTRQLRSWDGASLCRWIVPLDSSETVRAKSTSWAKLSEYLHSRNVSEVSINSN